MICERCNSKRSHRHQLIVKQQVIIEYLENKIKQYEIVLNLHLKNNQEVDK